MTTFEIKKREFLKTIDSEETLEKLQKYLYHLKKRSTSPCQYSVKEIKERMIQSLIDAENGKGTPLKEVRKKYM